MSTTHGPRRALRSIAAVLAGMVVIVLLSIGTDAVLYASGFFPPRTERMADSYFLLATAYRVVYTVAGCYIAARLTPPPPEGRPMRHALAVGLIGLVLSIAGAVATRNAGPELGPKWYPIAIIAIAMPCAWAGGRLREMQLLSAARADPRH